MKQNLYLFVKTVLTILRIIRKKALYSTLINIDSVKHNEVIAIGNGPSFKDFINKNINFFEEKDILCMNDFAISEYFETLKPNHYVIVDPAYFEKDMPASFKQIVDNLENALNKKTSWNMFLYIPKISKNTHFNNFNIQNHHITIINYNILPIEGFNWFKKVMFKFKIGAPYIQNVLVAGLHILLMLKYKKIFICGADHGWHIHTKVDEQCTLLLKDTHFYDNTISYTPWIKNLKTNEGWKVHEIFFALSRTFQSYHEIQYLSRVYDTEIYNLTENSFIDAFKKVRL